MTTTGAKYLAHRVVHDGRVLGLSVVQAGASGISVQPFSGETAGTAFVDGTLIVDGSSLLLAPQIIEYLPLPAGLQARRIWPRD